MPGFRCGSRSWMVALLLMAVAVSSALLVAVSWRAATPLAITTVEVGGAAAPPALFITGCGVDRTVQALLLTDFAAAASETLVPALPLYNIDTDGRLAVASTRDLRIVTIDVSDGQRPRLLGSIKLQHPLQLGTIGSLIQLGSRAVVALSNSGGLVLLDLDDPQIPRVLHHLPMPEQVADLLAVEGRVYAACRKSGVWQVSNAGDRLQAVRLPGLEQAWRVARAGNRLVAVSLQGELALYDLDAAGHPSLAGLHHMEGEVRGVALGPEILYLSRADGSLREYSLTAWPRLHARGQLQLAARPLLLQLSDDGTTLLCSLTGVGACVIDVRHAGTPTVVGWLTGTGEAINDLTFSGGRVLTVNSRGLRVHRLDDLRGRQSGVAPIFADPQASARLTSWHGHGVAYSTSAAVPLTRRAPPHNVGLLAVPAVPVGRSVHLYRPADDGGSMFSLEERLLLDDDVAAVLQRDDRLYVLGRRSLVILSRASTGGWVRLGGFAPFVAGEAMAWVEPDRLLVADRHHGLFLLDVSVPSAPRMMASRLLPEFLGKTGGIYDLLVSGGRAYVARSEFGVQVIALSQPGQLRVLQQIDTPGLARRLALHDDLLLVADRGKGIQVIDTRTNPCRLVATLALSSHLADMIVHGDEILVVNSAGMLARLPVPLRLPELQREGRGRGQVPLPQGLAAGRYQLVLYDATRLARAGFAWPGGR